MADPSIIDYGILTNLGINIGPDILTLIALNQQGHPVQITLEEGIARSMWSHLTRILYPRAAETLTTQAETARRRTGPLNRASYLANVTYHAANNLIEMRGVVSSATYWIIRFSTTDGHDVWAALEDIFDNV